LEIEREVLARTNSDWHTKLHYAFQDSTSLYVVMDYFPGGDLQQLLENHPSIFNETAVRFYTAELVLAVNDLHRLGFIHRSVF
jgi:serine/threonine protein kinase